MDVAIRVAFGETLTLRNSEIEHLEIVQALSAHTRCHLAFYRDSDTDLHLDALLGQPLTVTLVDEIGEVTAFTGFVLEGSQGHQLNHGSAFTIEGISQSWSLERHQTAYYSASTLNEIAARFNVRISGAPLTKDPMQYVQLGESDFDFLVRVADDHGMFVRTTDARVEARAGFEETGLPLRWARDLLAVNARTRTAAYGTAGAAHRPEEKRDHRFRNVRKAPSWLDGAARFTTVATKLADRAAAQGAGQVVELPERSPRLPDARKLLERESERLLGASLMVSGTSTNIRVAAGHTVKLEESQAFALPTQGTLGVVRVTHRYDGQLYSNDFEATPWGAWSNPTRPARRVAPGVATAEVVDNVDPSRMGRVKVRLRWNDADESTRWTRVATTYTGNGRGTHFLPEIGDEVLVAFEQGDAERPIVIGSLWNGVDKAPTDEDNRAKRIITRTGNTIQLIDADDEERIEIYTAKGECWIQLSNNNGNPVLTIHSEGDIALEARNQIRLTCQTLVENVGSDAFKSVGGDDTLTVSGSVVSKAGMKHTSEGLNTIVRGGAMVDVASGGITSVIGAMVHIQPPGKVVPPAIVAPQAPAKSAWEKAEQPRKGEGRTSADPRIGR